MRPPQAGALFRVVTALSLTGLFLGAGASTPSALRAPSEGAPPAPPIVLPRVAIQLPESAVLLATHLRDVTSQNVKLTARRGDLTRQISEAATQRMNSLAQVERVKRRQHSLRANFEEVTAAAYQRVGVPSTIDLTSVHSAQESAHAQVVLEKILDETSLNIATAEKELSTARTAAASADERYRTLLTMNEVLDRRIAWVTMASGWVRARVAPDPSAPVLPESDLPIGLFERAMAATRQAPCETAWWLVAAAANPVTLASDPARAAADAARWVCTNRITSPETIGAGAGANQDAAVTLDRATRWLALGFPDRPYGRVLVVGDSLGEGMKLAGLSKKLSAVGFSSTINTRVGRPTSEALSVLRANAGGRFALVVVETGTNDGGNSESYRKAIETTLRLYDVPILWIPPHLQRFENFDRVVEDYAASEPRLHIVDWDPAIAAHPQWVAGDGVHLTMAGYAAMADLTVASVTATG